MKEKIGLAILKSFEMLAKGIDDTHRIVAHTILGDKQFGRYLEKRMGVEKMENLIASSHVKAARLLADIEKMAATLGIKTPKVKLMPRDMHGDEAAMSALYETFFVSPKMLDSYSSDQIEQLAWHEMGHIKNKDVVNARHLVRSIKEENMADKIVVRHGDPAIMADFLRQYRDHMQQDARLMDRLLGSGATSERVKKLCTVGTAAHPPLNRRIKFFEREAATKKTFAEKISEDFSSKEAGNFIS